ncbi:putative imidazolonepropionase like protein [Argiope bruennichi]|uniref:Probable imidazolonepropionase n=1 Tax=Argiope bruennichi TaxID=94029 RepID=A0A8T0EK64_ARGBR|nr:putative imidazolonepropionase like protein [Argiope bruennichi]
MKLAGMSYMDIHKIGGGIYYTVEQTRKASENTLLRLLLARLDQMLKSGTTLVEAKSGYGLQMQTEMKMLQVIEKAKIESPIEISSTFCGAHAVPKHMTSHQATEAVLNEQLPAVAEFMKAGEFTVDNIDVFCEKGVFDLEQSRRILSAGKEMGLQINFHGDELNPMEAAKMGAELGAKAISHLEEISTQGILAMAQSGTVAVVLPTTAYMLRLRPPPVKRMIEAGVPIALGTDFNPNAFCYSMPLVMHLACVLCGMTMEQALQASTINAAAALGKADTHGSLERGKCADMLIINAPRWEHLIYQMGAHSSLIDKVMKKGKVKVNKQWALAVTEIGQHDHPEADMRSFQWGCIHVLSLLALTFAFLLKIMILKLIFRDNMVQGTIFIIISLHVLPMMSTFSSPNRMWRNHSADYPELQLLCQDGVSGTVTNAQH